jgi:uncharacterized membrane protein YkvA (DUF1232 family)
MSDPKIEELLDDADLIREFEGSLDQVRIEKAERLLAEEARLFAGVREKSQLSKELTRVRVLFHMLQDHVRSKYHVSPRAIAAIVAGLSYLIWPADLIPDFIPVLGQLDDLAVILLVWLIVRGEIEPYVKWRARHDPEYFAIYDQLYGKKA